MTRVLLFLTVSILLRVGTLQAAIHERVAYAFGGDSGSSPVSGLLLDASGNIFGTTEGGGVNENGTVFEVVNTRGERSEIVLHSFQGGSSDGAFPNGSLIMDTAGNLFGTTLAGGAPNNGIVFELSPSQSGWTENILHAFGSTPDDGCRPTGDIVMDSAGNIYGATAGCGALGGGTIFELIPSGDSWSEVVIWAFRGNDGYQPNGGLIFDKSENNLYGTSVSGGFFGLGNVFKLTKQGGVWTATSVFSFTGGDNGCWPYGSVVRDVLGNLYGTTSSCGADNVGTVFQLTPSEGQWAMTILHTFTGGVDGAEPRGTLKIDGRKNLYGTTSLGGQNGMGTVFELQPGNPWVETEYSFKGGERDGANPYAGIAIRRGIVYGTTATGGTYNLGTIYAIVSK